MLDGAIKNTIKIEPLINSIFIFTTNVFKLRNWNMNPDKKGRDRLVREVGFYVEIIKKYHFASDNAR